MNALTGTVHDLIVSARRLRQSPVFTIFSIVTLALGIGAATAAYSAMYAVALRPMGFDDTNLVLVNKSNSIAPQFPTRLSWPDYEDLIAQQRGFAGVAAWTPVPGIVLAAPAKAEIVQAEAVTGSYFTTIGLRPALGRLIQPADDDPSAAPVIVLSDTTWRSQFDADPSVVGTAVKLGGQPITVIGVAPTGFRGVTSVFVAQNAGWVPLALAPRLGGPASAAFAPNDRGRASLYVGGRLAPGVAIENAAAEMATIAQRLDAVEPLPVRDVASGVPGQTMQPTRGWSAIPADVASLTASEAGRVVLALPAMVLLVACTNLTNLVVSRGATRRQEMAVRGALGASRWRLIREELGEMAIVAAVGGFFGALVAHALLTWTVATLQEPMASLLPGQLIEWRLEPIVFVAAGMAALLAMVIGGVLPAWRLTGRSAGRPQSADALASLPRWRGRSNLIALQVGVSVTLFLLTAISVRFLVRPPVNTPLQRLGEGLERVAVATVPFGSQRYSPSQARETLDAVLPQVRLGVGVEAVGVTSEVPGLIGSSGGGLGGAYLATPDRPFVYRAGPDPAPIPATPSASLIAASPELFAALRLRPERGRVFDERDAERADRVVVLNQMSAMQLFGSSDPVGRIVTLELSRRASGTPATRFDATVIGVLAPSGADSAGTMAGRPQPIAYVPFAQQYSPNVTIIARASSDDARPLVAAMVAALRRADPELAVLNAGRADVMARMPFTFLSYLATVSGGLAALALALTMAGLYGVLSHVVTRRMREMGLRIALGADRSRIVRLIFRNGFRPVVEGMFIGLGSAWVIRQVAQSGFTGTLSGIDATLVLMAAGPLVVAATIACYLPARRASRVDPNVALRDL